MCWYSDSRSGRQGWKVNPVMGKELEEESFNLGMDRESKLVGKRCMAGVLPWWRGAL